MEKTEHNIQELWNSYKRYNMCNLNIIRNKRTQGAQRTPRKQNAKTVTHRHITFKLQKIEIEGIISKRKGRDKNLAITKQKLELHWSWLQKPCKKEDREVKSFKYWEKIITKPEFCIQWNYSSTEKKKKKKRLSQINKNWENFLLTDLPHKKCSKKFFKKKKK